MTMQRIRTRVELWNIDNQRSSNPTELDRGEGVCDVESVALVTATKAMMRLTALETMIARAPEQSRRILKGTVVNQTKLIMSRIRSEIGLNGLNISM